MAETPVPDRALVFAKVARVQELCEAMSRSGEFKPTAKYRDGAVIANERVVEAGREALRELADLFGQTPRQLLDAAAKTEATKE